jgi:hypothetical protein
MRAVTVSDLIAILVDMDSSDLVVYVALDDGRVRPMTMAYIDEDESESETRRVVVE